MKATVVYRSSKGKTRRYAEAIGAFLRDHGLDTTVVSVGDCDVRTLADVDVLLLGSWTNGYFVVGQHPDQPWLDLVRDLPRLDRPKVGIFTTYLIVTGSMFSKMRRALAGKTAEPAIELKSRSGELSAADRQALEAFIGR